MGHDKEVGVIPRFSQDLFRRIEKPMEKNVSIDLMMILVKSLAQILQSLLLMNWVLFYTLNKTVKSDLVQLWSNFSPGLKLVCFWEFRPVYN